MDVATLWWTLAAGLVALELFTGSFYLLMLALGLCAGAIAAHLGGSAAAQFVSAAVVGAASVVALHLKKRRVPGDPAVRSMRSVNLDVGEIVHIDAWQADGTASVKYRGAQWAVVRHAETPPEHGAFKIHELQGNRLVVVKA